MSEHGSQGVLSNGLTGKASENQVFELAGVLQWYRVLSAEAHMMFLKNTAVQKLEPSRRP